MQMHDYFHSPSFMVMVLDLYDMDLSAFAHQDGERNPTATCVTDWLPLCQQLAGGVSRLAACHVMHRDLHSKNVLVRLNPLSLAITDMGKAAAAVVSSNSAMTARVYAVSSRAPEIFFCQQSKFHQDGHWLPPSVAVYGLDT